MAFIYLKRSKAEYISIYLPLSPKNIYLRVSIPASLTTRGDFLYASVRFVNIVLSFVNIVRFEYIDFQ